MACINTSWIGIPSPMIFDPEQGRRAAERIRARLAAQAKPVSEEQAQRNWEELKKMLEAELDERIDRWLSSSTPQ